MRGEIPVCREIAMEMERIDDLIANPGIYYDDKAVNGFISFCEDELTLTDGTDVKLLDSFKLWAEEIFGWYYFVERSVFVPNERGGGGHYETRRLKKRLLMRLPASRKNWKKLRQDFWLKKKQKRKKRNARKTVSSIK